MNTQNSELQELINNPNFKAIRVEETSLPDDYLGLCPKCHKQGTLYNFGEPELTNAMSCQDCKTWWIIGFNVFTSTRTKAEDDTMWSELDNYTAVEPYHHPETLAARSGITYRDYVIIGADSVQSPTTEQYSCLVALEQDGTVLSDGFLSIEHAKKFIDRWLDEGFSKVGAKQ